MNTLLYPALLLTALGFLAGAQEVQINVDAKQVLNQVSRLLTGACIEDVNHEIYGGLYSQMIFGESFQESAPSPSLQGFQVYGGRWTARDGAVRIQGAEGPKLVSQQAAFKDGAVGVELFLPDRQGESAGLIVRVDKPGVGADNFTGYEVALNAARQTLRLGRHRHNFEPIKDVPCAVATGRWIALEVRLAGTGLEILVDGQSVLRHEDGPNALSGGTVGLRVWQREASFRNLWVKSGEQRDVLALDQTEDGLDVSRMWAPVRRGTASGRFAFTTQQPFVGGQSQQIRFEGGEGEWGLENQGLNRWGLNFVAARAYEGCVWARAETATTLFVALENADGGRVHAEKRLSLKAGDWQRLAFSLTAQAGESKGRFVIKLKQPGAVTLGYALLQPGAWGRFKGLPVRRDVAEGLINQGVTVLRYGGSMVNHPEYRWKKMIGPRERRAPSQGTWYPHSSNGWGIPDFMDFCEAAGFEYIPAFYMDETPQDMADFIEYAKGPAGSEWGRRRVADGHRAPYRLKYIELGNEERVDEKYAEKFEALAKAIWAKDPELILVVGDFVYGQTIQDPFNFRGAASGITNLAGQQRILKLAKQFKREVWFDLHVGTDGPRPDSSFDGMLSFKAALAKVADGARHKVVVLNGVNRVALCVWQ